MIRYCHRTVTHFKGGVGESEVGVEGGAVEGDRGGLTATFTKHKDR